MGRSSNQFLEVGAFKYGARFHFSSPILRRFLPPPPFSSGEFLVGIVPSEVELCRAQTTGDRNGKRKNNLLKAIHTRL